MLSACSGASEAVQARVYTCDDKTVLKPADYVLACGDGNASLDGVAWTSWTNSKAVGVGTYRANDCEPFCAVGHFHSYRGSVVMDQPVRTKEGLLFSRLVVTFVGKGPDGQRSLVDDELMPLDLEHPTVSPSPAGG